MAAAVPAQRNHVPARILRWLAALSGYWFASSFKWFILLVVILPRQVERFVPTAERSSAWGMVFGIGAVWAVFGPSIFGYWSDRVGSRRHFILWGGALTLFGLLALAASRSLIQLSAGYLLLQFSDDVGTGPYDAVIPDIVPSRLRGTASGYVNVAALAGQVSVAIAAMILRGNVYAVYALIAAVTAIGAGVTFAAISSVHSEPRPPVRKVPFFAGLLKGWVEPWRHKDFAWVWFTRFLFSLGLYLVQPYLRFYVSDSVRSYMLFGFDLGNDASATSLLVLTISVAGAVSAIYGGTASDRYGRKTVIYCAGTLMAILLITFLTVHDFLALWILSGAFGLCFGAYLSASMAFAIDVLPSAESHGKDMGIWQMSISSVQILAGGAGVMVDYGNSVHPLLGYQLVFGLASILFLVGATLVRNVGNSKDMKPA